MKIIYRIMTPFVAAILLSACTGIKVSKTYSKAKRAIYQLKGSIADSKNPAYVIGDITCSVSGIEYRLDQYYWLAKQNHIERGNFIKMTSALAYSSSYYAKKDSFKTERIRRFITKVDSALIQRKAWVSGVITYKNEARRNIPPDYVNPTTLVTAEVNFPKGQLKTGVDVFATYGFVPLELTEPILRMGQTNNAKKLLTIGAEYTFYCVVQNKADTTTQTAVIGRHITLIPE